MDAEGTPGRRGWRPCRIAEGGVMCVCRCRLSTIDGTPSGGCRARGSGAARVRGRVSLGAPPVSVPPFEVRAYRQALDLFPAAVPDALESDAAAQLRHWSSRLAAGRVVGVRLRDRCLLRHGITRAFRHFLPLQQVPRAESFNHPIMVFAVERHPKVEAHQHGVLGAIEGLHRTGCRRVNVEIKDRP